MTNGTPASPQSFTVAITGTNRGIGRAVARAFAEAGARLLVHARRAEDVAGVVDELGATGVAGDLLDDDLPERFAATAERDLGALDALILNAAVLGPMVPLAETSPATFEEAMRVNVDAQFRLFQAALPLLTRRARSVIVWLSSYLGRHGLPRYGVYCVSKHAVEGLAKAVAADYAEAGVVSIPLAPGMVKTEMLSAALQGEDTSPYTEPEDAGAAIVRLVRQALGPDGQRLSGQPLDIEGWL